MNWIIFLHLVCTTVSGQIFIGAQCKLFQKNLCFGALSNIAILDEVIGMIG